MKTTFSIAEVKSAVSDSPNGEFEVIMSTDSIDRDGESIAKGAFNPLPASVPVHAFHDFSRPIGRVVPSYDEKGRLVGRGFFGSDPESQLMRQKVADGIIGHTSVGFMAAEREQKDGVPNITRAEILELSFVSVPSNRDAAVLMAKSYAEAVEKATAEAVDGDVHNRLAALEKQVADLLATKTPEPAAASAETTPDEAAAPAAAKSADVSAFLAAARAQAEAASVL
jgi:HK97 family phage prohead protease